MPYICTTITNWITKTIVEPISTWATQQQQQCNGKWWNPFCWLVTIVIPIIVWITKEILTPIIQTICKFVSWFIYKFASIFTINLPFLNCEKIVFIDKKKSTTNPSQYHYIFHCNCKNCSYHKPIEFDADNDEQATEIAKDKCKIAC